MALRVTSEFCKSFNFVEPLFLHQEFGCKDDCTVHTSEGFGEEDFAITKLKHC